MPSESGTRTRASPSLRRVSFVAVGSTVPPILFLCAPFSSSYNPPGILSSVTRLPWLVQHTLRVYIHTPFRLLPCLSYLVRDDGVFLSVPRSFSKFRNKAFGVILDLGSWTLRFSRSFGARHRRILGRERARVKVAKCYFDIPLEIPPLRASFNPDPPS